MPCARSCPTATGSPSATAIASTTRSTARARRPWSSCRPGASCIRASTRRRSRTSASASAASPTTRGQRPVRPARRRRRPIRWTTTSPTRSPSWTRRDAGEAILVGLSFGGLLACCIAAYHPERVEGGDPGRHRGLIGPDAPLHVAAAFPDAEQRDVRGLEQVQSRTTGWRTIPTSPSTSSSNIFSEPHSTKQIEDGIGWAADTTGPVLVKTVEARAILPTFDVTEAMYRRIRCPVLAIHGDDDQIQPHGRGKLVAELPRRRARDHRRRRPQSARPLSRQVQCR